MSKLNNFDILLGNLVMNPSLVFLNTLWLYILQCEINKSTYFIHKNT